jgi:Zn-dependent protease with chaperone function
MYNQIVYFIVVLILFSLQQQTGKAPAASPSNAMYSAVLFLSFALYCRAVFEKFLRQASRGVPLSVLTRRYYYLQARLSILALGLLVIYIYIFNLKIFLRIIPGFDKFGTISGITGIAIYLIHLGIIWYWGHPAYQTVHNLPVSRFSFIKGNLSFASVILMPWFLISMVSDLLQFIKLPAFLGSDLGEILLVALTMVGFVLFGPWLIVRLWGCKPLADDTIRTDLENFCGQHDFRLGGFLLWPLFGGEMLTAAVVGILPGLRYILITPGLLRLLEIPELRAVVAHEMGHVRKKHLLLFILLFILYILLVYNLSDLTTILVLSNHTILNWALRSDELGISLYSLTSTITLIIFMVVYFRFIFGFFLRNSERQADLYAMELIGSPLPLVSSFEKIAYRSGQIHDLPNWHHYSIRQRIQFLFGAFHDSALIRKHERKLYGSAIAFIALVSALFFLSFGADKSTLAKNWRSEIALSSVEREISQQPENAELQAMYGGLLYEGARYSEAESVLRAALALDPDNASVLNNLAWLYATAPVPYHNPPEALKLAVKAASLSPEPFILDTLAEAYYINGRYEDALSAIDEALSKGPQDQSHYMEQREKFEKALKGGLQRS